MDRKCLWFFNISTVVQHLLLVQEVAGLINCHILPKIYKTSRSNLPWLVLWNENGSTGLFSPSLVAKKFQHNWVTKSDSYLLQQLVLESVKAQVPSIIQPGQTAWKCLSVNFNTATEAGNRSLIISYHVSGGILLSAALLVVSPDHSWLLYWNIRSRCDRSVNFILQLNSTFKDHKLRQFWG